MSTPVVATVAWLALLVVVVLGAAVVVLHRRLDVLTRAHSDRKWEIATLRSELRALRRDLDPAGSPAPEPEPDGTNGSDGADGSDDPARTSRSWPSSPTAWRRDRGRTAARPVRRRRPG